MKRIWLWRLGVLSSLTLWFWLTAPLSPLDSWGFDTFLRVREPFAPVVSARIAHLDITQKQLDSWSGTREEYDGLASLIQLLRHQGAQVVALDLLLIRGKDEDFRQFWEQVVGEEDVVLGRTLDENTRLPQGQTHPGGLLNLTSDSDGKLRHYRWYTPGPDTRPLPSLALAAYLSLREQSWEPDTMIEARGDLRVTDYDSNGVAQQRSLPQEILLDERANWQEPGPRNFVHVSPEQLRQWESEGGLPHLEGRVVLIGYVAPGSGDLGNTSLNKSVPKVNVHAVALNGLLQDAWYQATGLAVNCFFSLGIVLAAAFIQTRLTRRRRLAWMLTSLGGLGLSVATPLLSHWFLPWVSLLLGWSICFFGEGWLADQLRHTRLLEMQMLADSEDPLILKVVGDYQVVRKLGTGGFATVYQAVPTATLDTGNSVAIKIVHPASAESAEFRRRFMREIRISSQLRHPNIVEVYQSGSESGLLYLTMELLQGRPLRHYMPEGQPLQEEQVVALLRPMLEALDYAHGQSVVHRDLKPENVMIRTRSSTPPWEFTEVKIVDFGLAFDSQASQLTKSGEIFGTLDYLAPERIQGTNEDPRSDLYAVGVMAYEMLTGSNPFKHSNPGEAILFRLTQDPTHLSELRSDLTASLVHLVTALIARDPQQRPASAREVLGKL